MILTLLLILGILLLDQLSKYLVLTYLVPIGSYPLWKGILHFTYVENTGAAFGMLRDHRWVFLVFSTVAIAAILIYIGVAKPKDRLLVTALAFIAGGGIGNMIDRVLRGFVVDFIDVTCIRFYVFNIADCFVCIGCGLMLLDIFLSEKKDREARKLTTDGGDADA